MEGLYCDVEAGHQLRQHVITVGLRDSHRMPQGKDFTDTNFNSGSGQAAPPYVTLSILVAGVVGGVVIVVAVLFCCKCCSERSKSKRRFTLNDSLHITDIERSVTSPTSKYENVHSDLFSDPSIGSVEGIISSPRNEFHQKDTDQIFCEASETTKLKSDFEKEEYKNDLGNLEYSKEEPVSPSEEPVNDKASRRVSFQLEDLPPSQHLRKGRRFDQTAR